MLLLQFREVLSLFFVSTIGNLFLNEDHHGLTLTVPVFLAISFGLSIRERQKSKSIRGDRSTLCYSFQGFFSQRKYFPRNSFLSQEQVPLLLFSLSQNYHLTLLHGQSSFIQFSHFKVDITS